MDRNTTIGRRTFLTAGGALALASLAGCTVRALPFDRQRLTAEERAGFDPVGVETLTVANDVGDVVVTAGDGDAIEVRVLKRAADRETLERISLETELDGERLSVRTRSPDGYARPDRAGPSTNVSVTVPTPGPAVESVISTVGDVTLSGTRGDTRVHTQVGSLAATRVDGYLTLTTEVGNVEVGDVTGVDRATTGTGRVKVELGGIRRDTVVGTDVGETVVAVDPPLSLDLRAAGSEVTVDLPLEDRSGGGSTGLVAGRLNDGGPLLWALAGVGSVTVEPLVWPLD